MEKQQQNKKWTKEYDIILLGSKTLKEASIRLNKSVASCQCRRIKLKKKQDSYNETHRSEKYFINKKYLESFDKIETIIDVFSGEKSFWGNYKNIETITNDLEPNFDTNFHDDYRIFVKKLLKFGVKADIIDLDSFGSPWDIFEDSLKIAKKGIIMTFGDKRYFSLNSKKNQELLKTRYGIEGKYEVQKIIQYFINKAKTKKVNLKLYYYQEWGMTWRVWFKIIK